MRARRSLPQDSVGVFRDVFDLHTWHGAILALMAPKRKCEEFGVGPPPPARWFQPTQSRARNCEGARS
jgi:hypothetical protein